MSANARRRASLSLRENIEPPPILVAHHHREFPGSSCHQL